ncbi:MAG: glycosyltransferase family 4 protein [candidate division KSB1 bacterium]|nr:glycosyltransferase family 4 protein [candidate division KSB1 bacterium]MDZ7275638.1 glycosyltransferase family 4 protein [candidate division KSB1 bacterium]MDZ7284671.1 glycosyltransferase family 4 protein [candidate division KSB1 bacterium]MDZ7297910.1 glycosyltransferase family 4 protein [candidate division KSB1 bacterium]MDZ7348775.1 glycosyltransferase family 4 protein [candidate division KSB1 bacterium]
MNRNCKTHPLSVTLVSEQYAPDLSSTAQLFEELMVELQQQGVAVRVCTLTPGYHGYVRQGKVPWREVRHGVPVRRLPRLPFRRSNRVGEALNWLWGTVALALLAWRTPREAPLLISTNPPMAHVVGAVLKLLRGQRFIALFYDLHPELSCAVGLLREGSLIDRLWRGINRWALRHTDVAVAIGAYMERVIKGRYPAVATTIIHNWCDPRVVRCLPKQASLFAREHGLLDKFVVLFSGNMGWRQRLEILIEVAALLTDLPIRFVFIGDGVKKAKLQEMARARGLHNVLFFPYQPRHLMEHSLAAADLTVVSHEREAIGFGVPSKIYTYMAAGRAILGLASKPCELIDMVRECQCGWVFDEDQDRDAIADLLRNLLQAPQLSHHAGQRAREYFERHFTLQRVARQYQEVIQRLCETGPAPGLFSRLFNRSPQHPSLRQAGKSPAPPPRQSGQRLEKVEL